MNERGLLFIQNEIIGGEILGGDGEGRRLGKIFEEGIRTLNLGTIKEG